MSDPAPLYDDAPLYGAETQRVPPHNLEAELGVLGALFVNNKKVYDRVGETLRPEHFSYLPHGDLYARCVEMIEAGKPADPVTLSEVADSIFAETGGRAYLMTLVDAAVSPTNAGEYGRMIVDLAAKRRLINLSEETITRAYGEEETEAIIAGFESSLTEMSGGEAARSGDAQMKGALKQLERIKNNPGALLGVGCGLTALDQLLRGFQGPRLYILAGRPSMGKTAMALSVAKGVARRHFDSNGEEGSKVGFFSLEMSGEELNTRLISDVSGVGQGIMENGDYRGRQWGNVVDAANEIRQWPLFIDDRDRLSVQQIKIQARRWKRQGVGLIVVDHLGYIKETNPNDSKVNRIGEITKGLKSLAKELSIPVILLCQLNRSVEMRDPPKPQLSDLRDSGNIEEDADVVMFVYREAYYLERKEPAKRETETDEQFTNRHARWMDRVRETAHDLETNVAKNRSGPVRSVHLYFDGAYSRVGNPENREVGHV